MLPRGIAVGGTRIFFGRPRVQKEIFVFAGVKNYATFSYLGRGEGESHLDTTIPALFVCRLFYLFSCFFFR